MTEPEPLQQIDRTYVRFRGRKLTYFSGCDYFRLASHPKVTAALKEGLRKYGLNVAASRLTTGNHRLYAQLEHALKAFFGADSALLLSGGYNTNLVVAQALAGSFSHVLVDDAAHPSVSDAARFLDCPILRFQSRQAISVAQAVRRCGSSAKLVLLTDGMFSGDGSTAPLADYLQVLPKDALIVVDDAHGAGVLGPTGRGTPEHTGVSRQRVIQCVTLSKAFGTYGGAILGPSWLRQRILDRSQMFVGSTPLPLPLATAALAAVGVLKSNQALRRRLNANASYAKSQVRNNGFPLPDAPGPIIPIRFADVRKSRQLSRELLAAGVFPPFINYPGGPKGGYFRFVISSEHTRTQLDAMLGAVRHLAS